MVPGKTSRGDLRQRNRRFLLRLIQTEGPISQAELARRSGLGPASVSSILQTLIESGVLAEEGKTTSGLGRKASLLAFNRLAVLTVGVLIEQEHCEVALVDLSGRVLERATKTHPRYEQPDEVVALVAELLEGLVQRAGVRPGTLAGVGVAVPGLVNAKTGSVEIAANLGWRNVGLRSLFEQRLGLPAGVENIGRAKARAEALWGRGAGHENFICLEVGSGVGAGVVCDGRVLRGASASAGEVGHITLDPAGPRCSCGLNGCWEVFCSGPAIRRRIAMHLAADVGYNGILTATSSIAELAAAAELGDPLANGVIEETAGYMVRGLLNLICNFDPELVILSGFVVWDCPRLLEAVQGALHRVTTAKSLDVKLVAQGAESGVIAASAIISVKHIEKLAYA
jgi:N-acetylglucosamine repressor